MARLEPEMGDRAGAEKTLRRVLESGGGRIRAAAMNDPSLRGLL